MSTTTHWILNVAPAWKPDEDALECACCSLPFSFFRRRHHCRNCGGVYCNDCSLKRISLPQYGIREPVRVCDTCFPSKRSTVVSSSSIKSSDENGTEEPSS